MLPLAATSTPEIKPVPSAVAVLVTTVLAAVVGSTITSNVIVAVCPCASEPSAPTTPVDWLPVSEP